MKGERREGGMGEKREREEERERDREKREGGREVERV